MQAHQLTAEPRDKTGKGANRVLRRSGRIPAIVYGAGKQPQSISLSHNDMLLKLQHESFYSSILTINVNSEDQQVVLKDLQRHPHKPEVLHVDFLRIDEKQKITMRVPLHFINEAHCAGVKTGGGVINRIMNELEISCLPADLPEYIEVDLAEVNLGETLHVSDLKLPDAVELYALQHGGDASSPVVSVNLPKVVEEAEEVEEEVAPEAAQPDATEESDGKAEEAAGD